MLIETKDNTADATHALSFPPGENYLDLRKNPHAIEQIELARRYLPLRNFLTAVNSQGSVFVSVRVATRCHSPADASAGGIYEFASETTIVFVVPSLNLERGQYSELVSNLKELLERDSGDSVRGALSISSCNFTEQGRLGYCLGIQLEAKGDSAEQAEMRWGLSLARVQQALLFRARSLGQQIGV